MNVTSMDSSTSTADDLTTLPFIDQNVLLHQLRQRFLEGKIYTLVGDILVSVNPFRSLPIYGREHLYRGKWEPSTSSSRAGSDSNRSVPHIYSVASAAYQEMLSTGSDQCCVISGESGSGKTEACKYFVRQLTELSVGRTVLEQRIIQVSHLLEAFGNAKTEMNNNSSRFGKYLQLKFKQGRVTGAKINEYLLEKSRVVHQSPHEQNFHVFYWMLSGLNPGLRETLDLGPKISFRYLQTGNPGNDYAEEFRHLKLSLDLVGFGEDAQESIFTCLAAVLHLGNIEIGQDDNGFGFIFHSPSFFTAAELLGIESPLLEMVLTMVVSQARGETIAKHLSKARVQASRDAVAKTIYDRVFRWVVRQVNQLLAPTSEDLDQSSEIGILDIFGFEKFENNSFEQLCINLANEQLHYFFAQHIFHLEAEEYEREGIVGEVTTFKDNKPLLDAFLLGSMSLLKLLNDQCFLPQASDHSLLAKMNQQFKGEKFYIPSKSTVSGTFMVQHYAGKVTYSIEHFLDKNKDTMPGDASSLLRSSSNDLIGVLFRASITSTGTLSLNYLRTMKASRRSVKMGRGGGKKQTVSGPPTLGSQFKSSLQVLVGKMGSTNPHFVRCIKPNNKKAPDVFDEECVQTQLNYTGMLETVRIRRNGYQYRPSFLEFLDRFGSLVYVKRTDSIEMTCQLVLDRAGINRQEYKLGFSKLFLKHWHVNQLQICLSKQQQAATMLQKMVRGFLQRKNYALLLREKAKQEEAVRNLLMKVAEQLKEVTESLEWMNDEDEKRLLEERRRSEELNRTAVIAIPPIPPPSDLYSLPAMSMIVSDDDDDDIFNETDEMQANTSLRVDDFALSPPRPSSNLLKRLISVPQPWLHGTVTQKESERLLATNPVGTFLVRMSHKTFDYVLSVRDHEGFQHLQISRLPNRKYIVVGESLVFCTLQELVEHYQQNPLENWSKLQLTTPYLGNYEEL